MLGNHNFGQPRLVDKYITPVEQERRANARAALTEAARADIDQSLMQAVKAGDTVSTANYLGSGADPDVVDAGGYAALSLATGDCLTQLLMGRANPLKPNKSKINPLFYRIYHVDFKGAEALVAYMSNAQRDSVRELALTVARSAEKLGKERADSMVKWVKSHVKSQVVAAPALTARAARAAAKTVVAPAERPGKPRALSPREQAEALFKKPAPKVGG